MVIGQQSLLSTLIFFFLSTFQSTLVCDFCKLELSCFFSLDRLSQLHTRPTAVFVPFLSLQLTRESARRPVDLYLSSCFLSFPLPLGLMNCIYFTLSSGSNNELRFGSLNYPPLNCLFIHVTFVRLPGPPFLHLLKMTAILGAWVPQSIKRPILGFSSGQDLRVLGSSPT